MSRDAVELLQPPLGTRPETLDTVDVAMVISKLILRVKHAKMLAVPDINQPVVTAPAIAVDYSIERNMPANHLLQRAFLTIRNDLGINRTITLEDAEDDGLTRRAASAFASHAPRAEVRFINLDNACKRRRSLAFLGDTLSNFGKQHGHRAARQTKHFGTLAGGQIMREESHDLAHFTFTNFGTPIIAV